MPATKIASAPAHKDSAKKLDDQFDSPSFVYHKEDKDTLAYEHDRQKYMKTLDRARNKARKAFTWNSNAPALGGGKRSGAKPRSLVGGGEAAEAADLAREYLTPASEKQNFVYYTGATPLTEVKLADLVVLAGDEGTARVARGKKKGLKGGLDGDFEVIPAMPSVIVLDEKDFTVPDVNAEEAWECIDDEDVGEKETKVKASYAKVAASAFKETK